LGGEQNKTTHIQPHQRTMTKDILHGESMIRLGVFLGIFALMATWECVGPRRKQAIPRWRRWPGNIGVALLDTVLTRIIAPTGAVGFAMLAEARGWGVLNLVALPAWLELLLALLLLDLAICLQHRLSLRAYTMASPPDTPRRHVSLACARNGEISHRAAIEFPRRAADASPQWHHVAFISARVSPVKTEIPATAIQFHVSLA
jgi:hypothetical protein